MIKLGETWKFVELPRAVDPEKPVVASASGIRAAIFDARRPGSPARRGDGDGPQGPGRLRQRQRQAPVERRQERRGAVPRRPDPAPERHRQGRQGRPRTSSATASRSSTAWSRPTRPGRTPRPGRSSTASSTRRHQALLVRRVPLDRRRVRACGTRSRAATSWPTRRSGWRELEGFLNKFGKSDEAAEVWLQLGSSNEFNAEEDKAREDYTKLVESFPDTPAGKKAAGALRRLDLVGKSITIKGTEPPGRDDRHGRSFAASRCWSCSGPRGAASRSAASFPTWSSSTTSSTARGWKSSA